MKYHSLSRVLIAVATLSLVATSVHAKILSQKKRACVSGGYETFTIIEDDCSGAIHTLYVDCLGNEYLDIPEPRWRAIFSESNDPFPEDFWSMVDRADRSTPGGHTGIYLLNINNERVDLRTPIDQAEADYYGTPCPSTTIH